MLTKLVVVAAMLCFAAPQMPTSDSLDPDRRLVVFNYTKGDPTRVIPDASPTASQVNTDRVSFDKVKFACEIVGGTLTSICVLASIIYAVRNGARLEDVLAQHLPIVLQLRDIWRPAPRVQADLIDL